MLRLSLALGLFTAVLLASGAVEARAAEEESIFSPSLSAGTGVYRTTAPGQSAQTSGVLDIGGMIIWGQPHGTNVGMDANLMIGARQGTVQTLEGEFELRAQHMFDDRWGIEARVPLKYLRDGRYFDLNYVEVSAIMNLAQHQGHRVAVTAGVSPYTERRYSHAPSGSVRYLEPVVVGEGFLYRPDEARVGYAPSYSHDPRSDLSYLDNSDVYFGGGTLYTKHSVDFQNLEQSVRIPVSVRYEYENSDKTLVIQAQAYYTLRAGRDALQRIDTVEDRYEGYVAYHNVNWRVCEDTDGETYYCDPIVMPVSGYGYIEEKTVDQTTLKARSFLAGTMGGKVDATYQVYRNDILEFLLSGRLKAEHDSHVMDQFVGKSREANRVQATLIGTVRF